MDSMVASRKFLLSLKIDSKEGERKLKRLLESIQGVRSVEINGKQGTVTISGIIPPSTIVKMLENYGKKAELLWEEQRQPSGRGQNDDVLQLFTTKSSQVVDHHHQLGNPKMVEQLQQLSRTMNNFEKVEVTYSTTIRVSFSGNEDMGSGKETEFRGGSRDGRSHHHHHHCCCCCKMKRSSSPPPPPASWYVSSLEPAPSWPVYINNRTTPSAPPLTSVYNQSPLHLHRTPPPPPPPVSSRPY